MADPHRDPAIVAFVGALEVVERPLEWILGDVRWGAAETLLGDVTIMNLDEGTGVSIERREGPAHVVEAFDRWARAHVERFLTTRDPALDGWTRVTQDEHGEPVDAWHIYATAVDDSGLSDMSFLDGMTG